MGMFKHRLRHLEPNGTVLFLCNYDFQQNRRYDAGKCVSSNARSSSAIFTPRIAHWLLIRACRLAGVEQDGVQIVSDPTFETTRIRFQISAASEEELQSRLRALHQAAQEGRMKGIFLAISVP
jgi:hypothetical protein